MSNWQLRISKALILTSSLNLTVLHQCVKMNKGKAHSKWSREALKGELSITAYFTDLGRKKLALPQEGGRFSLWTATVQPMRGHHRSELPLSSNGLLLLTAAPDFLLFLYKIMCPFFVLQVCLWFTIVCMS